MKRFISLALVGIFSVSILGCRASGEIDGPDDDSNEIDGDGDRSMKKTTTYDEDGNVVHKERSVDND